MVEVGRSFRTPKQPGPLLCAMGRVLKLSLPDPLSTCRYSSTYRYLSWAAPCFGVLLWHPQPSAQPSSCATPLTAQVSPDVWVAGAAASCSALAVLFNSLTLP